MSEAQKQNLTGETQTEARAEAQDTLTINPMIEENSEAITCRGVKVYRTQEAGS